MSDEREIPEELMKLARDAEDAISINQPRHWVLGGGVSADYRETNALTIAKALLAVRDAERKRAAAIADMHDHRGDIAAAILSP